MKTATKKNDHIDSLGGNTRLLINAALDAIVCINLSGEIIQWNPQAATIFGWSEDEMIGQAVFDTLLPKRYCKIYAGAMKHYLETGTHPRLNQKLEMDAVNREGNELAIQLRILAIEENGQSFFCVFINDISKQKAQAFELEQQKEFSQTLINGLPGIFYLFDATGSLILWNKNVEEISGYTSDEIREMHPLQFFDVDEQGLLAKRIAEVFELGKSDVEANFFTKDKRKLPFFFNGKRIQLNGKTCLMGMGLDISARIQIQNELDAKKLELQQKMTTAVITAQESERSQLGQELHDNVNQVLTTIKLYIEMMQDGLGDPIMLASKSVRHLQECIDEIRIISKRLSAPTLGNISLTESIKELVESINVTRRLNVVYHLEGIFQKNISQEMHLALYRIVQEQLNNILKYANASFATISVVMKEKNIQMVIKDDGKGFNAAKRMTGIGLNNMRTRAESLGGSFNIRTAPGEGCEVWVSIPIKKSRNKLKAA